MEGGIDTKGQGPTGGGDDQRAKIALEKVILEATGRSGKSLGNAARVTNGTSVDINGMPRLGGAQNNAETLAGATTSVLSKQGVDLKPPFHVSRAGKRVTVSAHVLPSQVGQVQTAWSGSLGAIEELTQKFV